MHKKGSSRLGGASSYSLLSRALINSYQAGSLPSVGIASLQRWSSKIQLLCLRPHLAKV